MKHLIVGLFLLLSVASCHDVKKPEKPENLISKDKMAKIIIDMSLLTASKGIDKNALEKNNVSVQSLIYDKYDIDSLMLVESNEYYAYNIDEYEALYKKVDDSLKQLKAEFTLKKEEAEEAKRKKDSTQKDSKLLKKDLTEKEFKKLKNDSLTLPTKN